MILSFSEFNSLYESSNGYSNEQYSNGIEIMESLFTVMQQKEVLSESEIVTFLDNVLAETGWELNDEVYESYAEWLGDWTQFFDEGINEDESEVLFTLTRRGEALLEGVKDTFSKAGGAIKGAASGAGKAISGVASKTLGGKGGLKSGLANAMAKNSETGKRGGIAGGFKSMGKGGKIAAGVGGAALAAGAGYGAYKGIKALKARSAAKKAAAGQPGK